MKPYALPSLCRQFDWERIYLYESDIKLLLALPKPKVEPLFRLLEPHLLPTDLTELRKIVSVEQHALPRQKAARRAFQPFDALLRRHASLNSRNLNL